MERVSGFEIEEAEGAEALAWAKRKIEGLLTELQPDSELGKLLRGAPVHGSGDSGSTSKPMDSAPVSGAEKNREELPETELEEMEELDVEELVELDVEDFEMVEDSSESEAETSPALEENHAQDSGSDATTTDDNDDAELDLDLEDDDAEIDLDFDLD